MKGFSFRVSNFISTFFFVGKIPVMPGTLGSFVGLFLVLVLFYQPHSFSVDGNGLTYAVGGGYINPDYIIYVLIISSLIIHIIGQWASQVYSDNIGKSDPKEVVIDEVAGIFSSCTLVALFFASLVYFNSEKYLIYLSISTYYFIFTFILFRFFDIVKPWPVSWADNNLKGGLGIMLDDQIAALYSAITFAIMFFILDYFEVFYNLITVE